MLHFKETDRYHISEDLTGYADKLLVDGIFSRRLDLLTLGFAYAVNTKIMPIDGFKKHDLTHVTSLDEDTRSAMEAVTYWFAKEMSIGEPENEQKLLELFCCIGVAGVRALRERWEGKGKLQIVADIVEKMTS